MISVDLDSFQNFLLNFFVQISTVIFLLFVATKVREYITQFNDRELIGSGNRAIAFSNGGYYIAITLILGSSLFGESFGVMHDFVAIVSITLVGIVLLTINRFIVNRIYLKEFNAEFEIESENIAFATLQAGGFISMAIVLFFSFYNFEFTVDLLIVALFYFFLTQFALYFVSKLLFLVTPYDDIKELKRGNMAVALNFFGAMIALSLLFGNSVREVLLIDANTVAILLLYYTLSTLFILYIPTLITSLIVSLNKKVDEAIEEGNVAIATTEMMVRIIVAVVVIATIPLNIFIVF